MGNIYGQCPKLKFFRSRLLATCLENLVAKFCFPLPWQTKMVGLGGLMVTLD